MIYDPVFHEHVSINFHGIMVYWYFIELENLMS